MQLNDFLKKGQTDIIKVGEVKTMSFSDKHQCILCDVTSCRYHDQSGHCQLESIKVKPRANCHNGSCDESECGSYSSCAK